MYLPYVLFEVGVIGNTSGYHCLAMQTSMPPLIPLFYEDKALIPKLDVVRLSPNTNPQLYLISAREDMTTAFTRAIRFGVAMFGINVISSLFVIYMTRRHARDLTE